MPYAPSSSQDISHALTPHCTCKAGRDTTTGVLQPDVALQTAQAFANVGLALRNAGFEAGWSHVFKVVSYHAPRLDAEALSETVKNLKEHCPDHAPLWTCIGVNSLAGDEAVRVEVEVVADVGNGA